MSVMKHILLFSLLFSLIVSCTPLLGQNLVPNPSFEDANICSEFNTTCGPAGWFYTNPKSPGYGNSKLLSAEGEKHLNLVVIDAQEERRQYWQTKLLCPLQAGEKYRVKLLLTSPSKIFNVRDIGFHFSNDFIFTTKDTLIRTDDYLSFLNAKAKKLKNGWYELQIDYTSPKNFTHLMIGNFSKETNQQLSRKNKKTSRLSYIAIDDIAITSEEKIQCADMSTVKDSLYAIKSRHSAINVLPLDTPTHQPANDTVIIDNIEFDFDSSIIKNEDTLEYLKPYLMDTSIKLLRVVGFTDNSGTVLYNKTLSLQRASSVRTYLIEKLKIPVPIEIEGKGISEKYPDPQRNRRVEIWIYR